MGSFTAATGYHLQENGLGWHEWTVRETATAPGVATTFQKTGAPDALTFRPWDSLDRYENGVFIDTVIYFGSDFYGIVVAPPGDDLGISAQLYTNAPVSYDAYVLLNTDYPFPVCFVKGTLIVTPRGPVAIEELVEGDLVQGSSGWRTVKWLGWRKYGAISFLHHESNSRIAPVRIRVNAIADNVPSSDLLVSPWHHLLVEGKLVLAGDLVNGMTIVQETHLTEVAYYHLELDQFDVVMAHGVYSESWADGGNRDFFQNVDVTSLRPEDKIRRRAPRPGFDHLVLHKGNELVAIQQHVAQRAKEISAIEAKAEKAA